MSTILIVDDSESARETLISMLERWDYKLLTAENGPEALDLALRTSPDLILLDVMMPNMDGFEVCRRIRSMPQIAEVPVIILTALDDSEALLKGIEAGADDFLSKPIDRREMLARVRTITRLNRYRIIAEQRSKLEELAARLISAQELERLRISRELHDDLGQTLTTLMLDIRNLQSDLTLPIAELFARLESLHHQVFEATGKVRQLAHDLRPAIVDTLGLNKSLQVYCEKFSARTLIPVTLDIQPAMPELPDYYNVILYRVLQEALTNVAKHAQATHAWVELSIEGASVQLVVQDNGKGFKREQKFEGVGIMGMRERVELVGGTMEIHQPANGGVIITASLPTKNIAQAD